MALISMKPTHKRSHRSKATTAGIAANAITDHTLESDLPSMRRFAESFTKLTEGEREALKQYMLPGVALIETPARALDFYYGMYISAFQMYTMAYMSQNPMAPALRSLTHCIAARVVELYDGDKPAST